MTALAGVRRQLVEARALLEESAAHAAGAGFDAAYRAALRSRNLLFHAGRGLAAARGAPLPEMPVVGLAGGSLADHEAALAALDCALDAEDLQMEEHVASARMPYARYLGWVREELGKTLRGGA